MKQRTLTMAATLAALMVLAVVSVNAQTGAKIDAHVPFDFVAGETKLKAGDYSVTRIAAKAFLLRSTDNKASVVVQAPIAIEQPREGSPVRLEFKRYGSEYFLAQIWSDSRSEGRQVNTSKTEERLAKQWKQKNATAQMVEVFAGTK
jgi:hypothetical protein